MQTCAAGSREGRSYNPIRYDWFQIPAASSTMMLFVGGTAAAGVGGAKADSWERAAASRIQCMEVLTIDVGRSLSRFSGKGGGMPDAGGEIHRSGHARRHDQSSRKMAHARR